MKIPKSFMLFGTKINIVFDNARMNDKKMYGESDYSRSQITLSTTVGVDKISEDKVLDTYYHEKVHMILDMMKEHELSSNEKFVDMFAKLLRQSDLTTKY